ncbi:hypothetical protein, partial [Amycolatopsis sp. SID8362]|uniref:hypothetical protein n=1 Tax=Amycolatopsis sp. SID8362 TaxID=2690346 RepID=UPI0013711192
MLADAPSRRLLTGARFLLGRSRLSSAVVARRIVADAWFLLPRGGFRFRRRVFACGCFRRGRALFGGAWFLRGGSQFRRRVFVRGRLRLGRALLVGARFLGGRFRLRRALFGGAWFLCGGFRLCRALFGGVLGGRPLAGALGRCRCGLLACRRFRLHRALFVAGARVMRRRRLLARV